MLFLYCFIMIIVVLIGIWFYISIAKNLVLGIALAGDFLIVFFLSATTSYDLLFKHIATKNSDIVLSCIIGGLATIVYFKLLVFLHEKFRNICKLFHAFMAFEGARYAYPLALNFITAFTSIFGITKKSINMLTIFKDSNLNLAAHYVIVIILAIVIFIFRLEFFDDSAGLITYETEEEKPIQQTVHIHNNYNMNIQNLNLNPESNYNEQNNNQDYIDADAKFTKQN